MNHARETQDQICGQNPSGQKASTNLSVAKAYALTRNI